MSQVGRIGGHLLNPNLERNGVDLSFKNTIFDDEPVLYLQVDPQLNTTVNAADIEADKIYKIKTVGTTNFILIGSPSNNIGQIFKATGPVIGTGTAYLLSDDTDPNPESGLGAKIGVNTENPIFDLDVSTNMSTTNFIIGNQGYIDNVILSNTDTITTVSGPLSITPNQSNPLIIVDSLSSDNLFLNDNTIGSLSNSNIVVDANGTGKLNIFSNAKIIGDLYTTGNITVDGNLSAAENIIIGDESLDTLTIGTNFRQTLEPADDNTFNIGSVNKRWANLWSDNWQNADTLTITGMIVSDQTRIDGTDTNGEIFTLQSNDNLNLNPNTGVTFIEDTKWETNNITNLLNTPLIFTSTGIGYLRFMGDNGFVIPAGDNSSRPVSPEVGDTRWNSEEELLECFDAVTGSYITSIGPGDVVDEQTMEELGNLYSLILG